MISQCTGTVVKSLVEVSLLTTNCWPPLPDSTSICPVSTLWLSGLLSKAVSHWQHPKVLIGFILTMDFATNQRDLPFYRQQHPFVPKVLLHYAVPSSRDNHFGTSLTPTPVATATIPVQLKNDLISWNLGHCRQSTFSFWRCWRSHFIPLDFLSGANAWSSRKHFWFNMAVPYYTLTLNFDLMGYTSPWAFCKIVLDNWYYGCVYYQILVC